MFILVYSLLYRLKYKAMTDNSLWKRESVEVLIVRARLLLAAFLRDLIGWERESRNRAAGFIVSV